MPEMAQTERGLHYFKKDQAPDSVTRPAHYTKGGVECIEAIRAMLGKDGTVAYLRGNIVKYAWRCLDKGNAVEDVEKMLQYGRWLVEELRRGDQNP